MRTALEESGHLATHREVATCLQEYLGAETEQRRQMLNAARAAAEVRSSRPAYDDDMITMPNARAPKFDENAATLRKPRPDIVETIPLGQAPLRGDSQAVKKLLDAKVRSGHATPEEANMLKQACKAMADRPCIEEIKAKYPAL